MKKRKNNNNGNGAFVPFDAVVHCMTFCYPTIIVFARKTVETLFIFYITIIIFNLYT